MSIISLDEFKKHLGICDDSQDGQLESILDGLSGMIQAMTGRLFGDTREVTEVLDWAPTIFLKHMDIKSIVYVKKGYEPDADAYDDSENLTEIDAEDYRWGDTGRLVLSASFVHNVTKSQYEKVVVKYTYGNAEIGDDLKLAAKMFASDLFNSIDGEITNEKLDTYAITVKPSTTVKAIFDRYQVGNI